MHFLLLWQHWLVCLIPSFRTETAHSLLLPIQQSRSMVSPEETDVVPGVVFLGAVQKSRFLHGFCYLGYLVWSEIALIKPVKNVWLILHPKFRGKKYKTVL